MSKVLPSDNRGNSSEVLPLRLLPFPSENPVSHGISSKTSLLVI